MSNNMSFRQHGKIEVDENDSEIIELSSDDDAEQSQPPSTLQQEHNYNQSIDSSAQHVQQFKMEIIHDSVHLNSLNPYMGEAYQDDGSAHIEPTIEDFSETFMSEESDGDDFLNKLKTKHQYDGCHTVQYANAQPGTSYQPRTTAPSPATALVTSTTAPMTPAHHSTPSPMPISFSTDSQSNFASSTNQNASTENLSFNEIFKNADAEAAKAMTQFIDTKVKHHMEVCMNELMKKYDFVPKKSQNDGDGSKEKKLKRKNTAGHRSTKREKIENCSSDDSLSDLFGPSTSTPKYPAGKNINVNKKANTSKNGDSSSNASYFRFGNDFSFGRPKPQPRPKHEPKPFTKVAPKKPKDYGTVKNDDATLYLASAAAKKCRLCDKTYKRMVNHFRRDHPNYEVFVSRLSPQTASELKRSNPFMTKYARASGMQYLKMMCPFCEDEKDFFFSYWTNHIRTHTGEYTNECIVCNKISLNATHCGQATIKQKCRLLDEGLSAYLCNRCNWIQISEERVKAHVRIQHGDAGAYQKVVLIPALNRIKAHVVPSNALPQPSTKQQLPFIVANDRPPASVPSTGVQILENVVLHPSNAIVGANASGYDESLFNVVEDYNFNVAFQDGLNIVAQAHQLLGDASDDVEMLGDFEPSAENVMQMIKVAPIEEQILQNVFDSYGRNDTNLFMVRPWMDDEYGLKKICIDEICQFALYKCMYENCIYATNSKTNWQMHMAVHGQLIDFFKSKGTLEKNVRDKLIKYRECPYCCFMAKADHQVVRHMEEDHRSSIFQCAMCYYRTIEMDNMVLHMQDYHPNATKEVLLCGETREFVQQDEEILNQDCEIVKKTPCGQDGCTEEYACYNNLYAHLVAMHPGTYQCSCCSQTMGLDEHMIVDHLKGCSFPEFQCLKCEDAFDNIMAIREHMSAVHPSNYLFVGARRAHQPSEDNVDIQIIYIGDSQNSISYQLMKCAPACIDVLDEMDPKELHDGRQVNELKKLRMANPSFKIPYTKGFPRIEKDPKVSLKFVRYSEYAELSVRQDKKSMPLMVSYRCITGELIKEVPAIANFIDCEKDIDRVGCKALEFTGSMASMLRHRCKTHPSTIVFLQTDQKVQKTVRKIVRCTYHCQLCTRQFATRMDLRRHFYSIHSNHWVAAKISVKSQVIDSNDPEQPVGFLSESIDYFCCTVLKCTESDCNAFAGTRADAIAHYNDEHHDSTADIDGFQAKIAEHIMAHKQNEIDPYVQELRSSQQSYLFECQHCSNLFESLTAISQHFIELRAQNISVKRRFLAKRLYCCYEDNTVRTLAGMQRYARENPSKKTIVPVNMQLPMIFCGLCNYNHQKNGNLPAHFEQMHMTDGEWCRDAYNDAFLNSLNLGQIDIKQCQFLLNCCNIGERNLLRQIVDHVLSCERRFRCKKCPNQKFVSTVSFVTHCMGHDQNEDSTQIFEDLHNFKAFLALILDMQIILLNGLVLKMHEIRDTAFGMQLQGQIGQLVQEAFEREKNDLSLMTIV